MNDGISGRPIPEARGPHAPDVLTRLSPWVYAFGLVAALQLWTGWREWSSDYVIVDLPAASVLAHRLISGVVPPLLGAALFARHRDARRTMPLLVFGLALFAFAELLRAFDRTIFEFLAALSAGGFPTGDGSLMPAAVAYGVFTSLLGLFAALYTGAGLASARRQERTAAERPMAIWLASSAIVSVVVALASIPQVVTGQPTPDLVLQLGIGTVLSLFVTLAWAYLVAVTVGGWVAGEAPRRAWLLAAIATSLLFAVRLIVGAVLGVGEPWITVVNVAGYASLVAWLLLLAAFVLGLPSPPEPSAEASDAEPTADRPAATPPGSAAG